MPIYKTEVLGSKIEINYDLKERKKLINLIENFKRRIDEFPNNGKITNNKILFLAALKAEDDFEELKIKYQKYEKDKITIGEQKIFIAELNNTIKSLNGELLKLAKANEIEKSNNKKIRNEIIKLEDLSVSIKKKIRDSMNNE